jgi:transcriptional regulator with XRE-family HTH domain
MPDQKDDLRQRLAEKLAGLSMARDQFAKHAGVNQTSISRFLAGKALSYRSRSKIEAALAELADYD